VGSDTVWVAQVRNPRECLQLLRTGEEHRTIRSTHMNEASSRSHSLFQLLVEQQRPPAEDAAPGTGKTLIRSKFNLVDLAGSEKWKLDEDMESAHINELTKINLSLHTLGRCIAALSSRKSAKGFVPFRDSKLTRLLQDSLGGNTRTRLIATLSPSPDCVEESISTLKFADRAKQVMVYARVNEQREIDPAFVEKLQRELAHLKVKVLLRTGEAGSRCSHLPHRPATTPLSCATTRPFCLSNSLW
jgi:kinesin family protein 3/17